MTAPAFKPDGIPAELKALRNWIVWRLEVVPGRGPKPTKKPYAADGGPGRVNDERTWATFEEALAAYRAGGYDGLGLVFTQTGYCGVDLDGAVSADGALSETAQEFIAALPGAHMETSQSGRGLHLIVRGQLPPGGRRKDSVELYDASSPRYFALTGDVRGEPAAAIPEHTAAIGQLHAKWIADGAAPAAGEPAGDATIRPADQAVLDAILRTRDAAAVHALFHYGEPDERRRSEARFKLVCILCRATGDDETVKRLLWASALRNAKWATHRTLLDIDIRNARVGNPGPVTAGPNAEAEPVKVWSLREALANPPAPPTPVVPLLAWARRITLVAALDGLGKSTLFRAAAAAVTTGSLFLNRLAARGTVLWVLAEEPQDHLITEAVRFGADPDRFRWIERSETQVADLLRATAEVKPALVIVDTVHSWANVEEASRGESWRAYLDALKAVRDTGAAVLLSAEAVKSTGDYADSRAIAHAIDVRMILRRPTLGSPRRVLEVPKTRVSGVPVKFGVALAGTTFERAAVKEDDDSGLSDTQRQVLAAWRPGFTWGGFATALHLWRESGAAPEGRTSKSMLNTALKALVQAGTLTKDDETGEYARSQFLAEQEHAA
jgi:AAA domain-containing protein/bifunctional DNA primase/polymerase-like protein